VNQWTIEVFTLADRHRKVVARGGTSPRYLATSSGAGHLVYVNQATLFAAPFDLDTLEVRGAAVPVLDDVAYESRTSTGQFDISRVGTMVYRKARSGVSALMTLQWVDPTGKKEPLRSTPGTYLDPALAPDGKRVAMSVGVGEAGRQDIGIYDPQRDAMTKVTFGRRRYRFPTWSPDGQYVVFFAPGEGLMQARADASSQPVLLIQSELASGSSTFSPDGKRLAYVEPSPGVSQIWTVPLQDRDGQLTAGKPEQYLASSFGSFPNAQLSFSPDGRWLAYTSSESGAAEVFVRPFPPASSGQGGQWQISNSGGTNPRWLGSGHELVYQSGDQIMAVKYTANGTTFVAEKPRVWIAKLGGPQWDISPDGKRVLVLTPAEPAEAPTQDHEVVFLFNFFDELRRRVPLPK
jgi:serine/threonine-protein kinase